MASLFRIFKRDFNPPPTVEIIGSIPERTPAGVDTKVLDAHLRSLARAGVARLEREAAAKEGHRQVLFRRITCLRSNH